MTAENKNMSFTARVIHMLGFEIFGVIIFTPIAMFVLHEDIFSVGVIAVMISLMAMVWNFIYNYIFDLVENSLNGHRSTRKMSMRLFHALLFEIGLLIVTVPLVAYWLDMSLLDALLIDIGFVVFYLIYALSYNYIFDKIYFTYFV